MERVEGVVGRDWLFASDEPPEISGPPSPHTEAAPVPYELRIVSEPAGARVSVDGERAPGRTPLVVTLPADTREVWLRLSREGYVDQERRVRAGIGEARFVLRTRGQ